MAMSGDQTQQAGAFDRATNVIKETAPEKLTACMRITNIINGGLLIASGVITFTMLASCSDNCSILIVLAFYTILFGLLLLVFEMRSGPKSANFILNNCGFMYSNRGKATFILFLATLCFSVTDKDLGGLWWFCLLVGIYTAINGIFSCAVVLLNPGYDAYTQTHHPDAVPVQGSGFGTAPMGGAPDPGLPPSDYRYGDAHAGVGGAGGYNSYELQDTQPQPAYGQSSTPFADNGAYSQNDDNPFSHV
ncbi:Hypothetical Protein FCC1311_109892 [Hondaea fermentalgiana]|uniref:COPI associated protein n=1 Tax=Hondaea fermentalgiana TaxID=2315210 RepID=A0A2R5GV94_9STRA|nr:Hypothetical Protein FCC1311_109892 [Hondaea fermentalgiana]|eukprot:GBG34767.1 Hypothetical Protein FCC1311_109892 [Hondaea fermentalgiana]